MGSFHRVRFCPLFSLCGPYDRYCVLGLAKLVTETFRVEEKKVDQTTICVNPRSGKPDFLLTGVFHDLESNDRFEGKLASTTANQLGAMVRNSVLSCECSPSPPPRFAALRSDRVRPKWSR